jgi:membrane protein
VTERIRRLIEVYERLTADESTAPVWFVPARAVYRWALVFYRQLRKDRAFVRAAAMAYTTLIALVPLLLLVFGILFATGTLPRDADAINELLFETFLADIPEVSNLLIPGIVGMDLGALSAIGIGGLVFTASRLYLMVERAYNDVFGVAVHRKMGARLLNFYLAITAGPVVAVIGFATSVEYVGGVGRGWSREAIEFGSMFLLLTLALKLFPCTVVKWRAAIVGALISSVLIDAGKAGFELYLQWFRTDDPTQMVYGSVGLLPVFLVWLYLLWVFVLLGVEVAYVVQDFESLVQVELGNQGDDLHRAPAVDTALEVAAWVAWHFQQGSGPVQTEWVAHQTALSPRRALEVLELLTEAEVLVRSEQGWTVSRPPVRIDISQVVEGWRRLTDLKPDDRTVVAQQVDQALAAHLGGTLGEALEQWVGDRAPQLRTVDSQSGGA